MSPSSAARVGGQIRRPSLARRCRRRARWSAPPASKTTTVSGFATSGPLDLGADAAPPGLGAGQQVDRQHRSCRVGHRDPPVVDPDRRPERHVVEPQRPQPYAGVGVGHHLAPAGRGHHHVAERGDRQHRAPGVHPPQRGPAVHGLGGGRDDVVAVGGPEDEPRRGDHRCHLSRGPGHRAGAETLVGRQEVEVAAPPSGRVAPRPSPPRQYARWDRQPVGCRPRVW